MSCFMLKFNKSSVLFIILVVVQLLTPGETDISHIDALLIRLTACLLKSI